MKDRYYTLIAACGGARYLAQLTVDAPIPRQFYLDQARKLLREARRIRETYQLKWCAPE